MTAIPNLKWVESSATAILHDEAKGVWHSGAAIDLLQIDGDRLLVGSTTGGLWLVEPDGVATPLSDDWPFPDVRSIVQRAEHSFLCGTNGALFENDPRAISDKAPLGPWMSLPLPANVTTVNRIVVLRGGELVVIATNDGIYSAGHTDVGTLSGWMRAQWTLPDGSPRSLPGAWFDIAPTEESALIVAGRDTTGLSDNTPGAVPLASLPPIMIGQFRGPRLFFEAPVADAMPPGLKWGTRVSIGSCALMPAVVYAAVFQAEGYVIALFRSNDGGAHWQEIRTVLIGAPDGDETATLAVFARNDIAGGPLKRITVHPLAPDTVSFSGCLGFISEDGGQNWLALGGKWDSPGVSSAWHYLPSPHLHVDHHTIIFSPTSTQPNRIFAATDGGLFGATDWHDPTTFFSYRNRSLRTLQFLNPAGKRGFPGDVGTTAYASGISAGGTQDNANVWKLDNSHGTWRPVESEGDGGYALPLGATQLYSYQPQDDGTQTSIKANTWDGINALGAPQDVPLIAMDESTATQTTIAGLDLVNYPNYFDARDRKLMLAVAWNGASVYGLFAEDVLLVDAPLFREIVQLADPDDPVLCAASYDGHELLVGTTNGNIFSIDSSSSKATAMTISGLPPATFGNVTRLVATRGKDGFAALTASGNPSPRIARRVAGAMDWTFIKDLPADPLSGRDVFGMDLDDSDPGKPSILLVATDSTVWAATNQFDQWLNVSRGLLPGQPGLPTTAHCSDLRFNRFKRRWSLSTYGRSVWQAGDLVQVGVSSLLRSDYLKGADHYNFEALVLIGDKLFAYNKDNSNVNNHWGRTQRDPITDGVTAPACIVRSDFAEGADHTNFETLIMRGSALMHWHRDNSKNPPVWEPVGLVDVSEHVMGGATGPASMVVSDYQSAGHGNFEALIPTGSGLFHFWRNHATGTWQPATPKPLTTNPGSLGCIITTDYMDGDHRGLEALVFEPLHDGIGVVSHFKWHPDASEWKWMANVTDLACGPACLIQSDYVTGADHKNLEALVPMIVDGVTVLRHYWRKDDIAPPQWQHSEKTADLVSTRLQGSASMLQSDFYVDEDHGNFEALFVEVDNDLWHVVRDQLSLKWFYASSVI